MATNVGASTSNDVSSHWALLPADDEEDFPERGEWYNDDGADYDEN